MKDLMKRQEPKIGDPKMTPDVMENFDREISKIAKDLNGNNPPPARVLREQHQFVAIQKQAVEAMVQTHQDAVNEITNLLEEAKLAGEKMMTEIEERSQRLAELLERSKEFGGKALELCKDWHSKS